LRIAQLRLRSETDLMHDALIEIERLLGGGDEEEEADEG
jgi:hypothetical protein